LILQPHGYPSKAQSESGRPAKGTAGIEPETSTIVISYELFANPVLAESILDRRVNSAHHVLMDGKS